MSAALLVSGMSAGSCVLGLAPVTWYLGRGLDSAAFATLYLPLSILAFVSKPPSSSTSSSSHRLNFAFDMTRRLGVSNLSISVESCVALNAVALVCCVGTACACEAALFGSSLRWTGEDVEQYLLTSSLFV